MPVSQLYHPLIAIFRKAIEPTSSVIDPIHRQQIRLLNSIIVIFVPLALLTGGIHIFIDPRRVDLINDPSGLFVFVAVFTLLGIYWLGRRVGYQWAIFVILIAGYFLILFNAIVDMPYHTDIIYILLLSVVASSLLSLRVLFSLASLQIITTLLFFLHFNDNIIITLKITTFVIIANVLIVIMGYYRNQLEADRRQKLAESETFLRLITDQLPVSVWITDGKLKRRATFGRIQGLEQLVTIPTNIAIKAYYQALGGKSAQFEDTRNKRYLQYYVEPMRDAESKIIGTLGVATDITEQKLAQQQLLQLELERERVDMLSKFIEYSSHDLRTPLSNINTYLYLLDKAVQSDKEHGYVQVIREQSDRLHELIDNMLTLQRLELESDSVHTKVSLKSLLHEIETSVRSRIEAESLVFEYSSPQQDAVLNINKQHIHTALMKIIDNAIQFTSESGSIRLSATSDDQSVTISVQDTGVGIPQEKIPHIFELFYRGDDSRPTSDGDNGLGLAITERIIKSHKGTIRVDSIVDEGSTFYVTLPIANPTSIYK